MKDDKILFYSLHRERKKIDSWLQYPGLRLFDALNKIYGIEPKAKKVNYTTCMIDVMVDHR